MRQLDERRLRTQKILGTWGRVVAFAQLFFGTVWVVVAASTQKGRDEVFVLSLVLLLIGGATLAVFVWLSRREPSDLDPNGNTTTVRCRAAAAHHKNNGSKQK